MTDDSTDQGGKSLSQILSDLPPGDGFAAPFHQTWAQGRTHFGGLTAALLLEAANRAAPDLPPLRSAIIDFSGPVSDTATYQARILRQGRNITTVEATARIGEQVVGIGNFSFGAARESAITVPCPAPDAPTPEDTPPLIPPQAIKFAPGFHHNFDLKLIEGGLPGMGYPRGYMRGWARHRDPASRQGPVSQICIGDILPPAVFPLFPVPGPSSSVKWMFNITDTDLTTRDGWWQMESQVTAAGDGYSSQVMRMWSADGRLVADGMQSVVVFV